MRYRIWVMAGLLTLLLMQGCASKKSDTLNTSGAPRGRGVERTLETSAYCACQKCCNWTTNRKGQTVVASGKYRGQPKQIGITASGTRAKQGTIAADLRRYPVGTRMYIPGYGYGRVEDRGKDIKRQYIDLFFERHADALQWGRRDVRVKVWFP